MASQPVVEKVRSGKDVLSSEQYTKRLPDETLQHIFSIICFRGDFDHDERALHRLCAVDRRWRAAATSFPALWSTLPFIDLLSFGDHAAVNKANKQLDLYLLRSGSHPLSFKLAIGARAEPSSPAAKTIQRLVAECTRWERVCLTLLSCPAYDLLDPIRGHLPSLTNLSVELQVCVSAAKPKSFDVFAEAPNLRAVSWLTKASITLSPPPRDVKLPFSQLQEISVEDNMDTGVYRDLMSDPSPLLKSISCVVKKLNSLPPPNPLVLTHLEKLQIVADIFSANIGAHLDCLTLPALKHLEIRGRSSGDLYRPILNLLQRSGCSLDYLWFTCPPNSADIFAKIVALCPDLTVLGLDAADEVILSHLVFDPSAPSPALPKLKRLITHQVSTTGFNPSAASYEVLLKAIRSRITIGYWAEEAEATREPKPTLEEAVFLCDNSSALNWGILGQTPFQVFDHGTARLRQEELKTLPWPSYYLTRQWSSWKDRVNVGRHWRIHRMFRNWEKLDFREHDTHKLVRHGYPRMLRRMLERPPGATPGESVYFYRARAKRLLEKWKPYMLRDAREYSWAQYDKGVLVLRLNVTGTEDDDEELYRDLVGLERLNTPSDHEHLTKWGYPDHW